MWPRTAPRSPGGSSLPNRNFVWHADWRGLVSGAILAAGTIAVYSRTFSVPLLLDDNGSIANNPSVRRLWPLWPVFFPPNEAGTGGRPLLNFSYALNYAAGGTAVAGYHLINLLIHVMAGWALFALVRRTLRRPILKERFGPSATALALAVAAIWAWHPVQTESVTYLTQRGESLMGLFYLLTLYCFGRGVDASERVGRRIWFLLSVLACLAGVGTKEVIVTAPLAVFLYDRTFVSGSFAGAWRRQRRLYLALAATWIPLGCLLTGLHYRGMGFGQGGIAWWAYGIVECRVVVKYLMLAIWPHPLVFDYGRYVETSLLAVWPFALVLASLLALTIVALRRSPALGFAAGWFFLILAPASSIVPIVGAPMAESRLYLPLAGVAAMVVLGVYAGCGSRSLPVFAVLAGVLGIAAAQRNRVYLSEGALWADTVAKDPTNARAHNNLACDVLVPEGRTQEAIAEYEQALRLLPDFPEAHNNLALELLKLPGRLGDAIAHCKEALRQYPNYAEAHYTLGCAWSKLPGRLNDAIDQYREALRLKPDLAAPHNELGNAWAKAPGHLEDAIDQYREALRLKPDFAEAHDNLGAALSRLPGHAEEAMAEFQAALRLKPALAEADFGLGTIWLNQPGRLSDAIAEFEQALRLKPDYAEAHANLGNAFARTPDRLKDAVGQYEAALRLEPDIAALHSNLAYALNAEGRTTEAIAQYEAALRLDPNAAELHSNLGYILNAAGRTKEAIAQYEAALRLKPDFAPGRINLAIALLGTPGGLAAAEAQLEAVLRLEPENESARQILARIRASQP